ncbi:hypothetical protein [Burkholderia ubonensis]|uniref:hypothetical protein n=1 Tax=Burkholderia ubonensis TaxID=101571 RepID=UPI00358F2733
MAFIGGSGSGKGRVDCPGPACERAARVRRRGGVRESRSCGDRARRATATTLARAHRFAPWPAAARRSAYSAAMRRASRRSTGQAGTRISSGAASLLMRHHRSKHSVLEKQHQRRIELYHCIACLSNRWFVAAKAVSR